jgi:hypothetical protein
VHDIKEALDSFRALPLSAETKRLILGQVALTIWPD